MNKPSFHLLEFDGLAIQEQLEMEEALFRADQKNFCIINKNPPAAIILGLSCRPEEHVNLIKQKSNPLPIIKRFSGGGSVVVDSQTLFISFIANTEELKIKPFPKDILNWTEPLFTPLIPGFHIRENDYAIGDKKIGGNAQSLAKQRFCHHSTLLWDFEPTMMEYLLQPKKMPRYRLDREHHLFLDKIKHHVECKNKFLDTLTWHLKEKFDVKKMLGDELNTLLQSIKIKPYRRGVIRIQ